MTIGIYGGSFDPVHLGHLQVARSALRDLSLDRLIVIPAAVSPFKTDAAPRADDAQRMEMVRLAFVGMDDVEVSDRELRKGGVSYAIDTVREIGNEYPGAKIYFVIGQDSVEGLPRWKEYEELKRRCKFAAFPRTRESSTEIRRRISAGEGIEDMVPPSVAQYIKLNLCYNSVQGEKK